MSPTVEGRPIPPAITACSCWQCDPRGVGLTLEPTTGTQLDTDNVCVRIFECAVCGWSEGRPDPVP